MKSSSSSEEEQAEETANIPHLFRCPISLEVLRDPVTLCTGQTYDRSSIEKWIGAGNLTCPVTMQKLHDPSLVPNHTLRHLIHHWLQMGMGMGGTPDFHPNHYPPPDFKSSLAELKHHLQSHEPPLENKHQTLQTIHLFLAQDFPNNYSSFTQLGVFPLLLELVFGPIQANHQYYSQTYLKFVEEALVLALKLLPYHSLGHLNMLNDQVSKLECFLILFDCGTITIKTSLCHLVEAISSSSETKELCSTLGNNKGLLQRLVQLLLFVDNYSGASEAGVKAISALCSLESNREILVSEGAVDGLITYIVRAQRHERNLAMAMASTAMETLEMLLLRVESAKQALINNQYGVDALVRMVFRVSDHQGNESAVNESAVNSLNIICSDLVEARERAISAGVLTQLLLLLQSQSSATTKTKARMLLKLLRSSCTDNLTTHV